jgi:MFS family permease
VRTSHFLRAVVAMWWVFLSVGILIPLLPAYVASDPHAGGYRVGLAVLVLAVASVTIRPFAGRFLSVRAPGPLMLAGVTVGASSLLATALTDAYPVVVALRFVEGLCVGAFYTAAATWVVRETPSQQRARNLSYFSVPLFLGTAVGPVVGDWMIEHTGARSTWVAAAAAMLLALPACVGGRRSDLGVPVEQPQSWLAAEPAPSASGPVLPRLLSQAFPPSARWPALVLSLTISGYAGFQSFVPLYGPTVGLQATGSVFLLYSGVVLVIRTLGAGTLDRLPPVQTVLVGTVFNVVGLAVVCAVPTRAALFVAAVCLALAVALSYTLLMKIALHGMPRSAQGSVVGAYSAAYDVGSGVGALVLGTLVSLVHGYRIAFLGGAVLGVFASGSLVRGLWASRERLADRSLPADDHPLHGRPRERCEE